MNYDYTKFNSLAHDFTTYHIWSKEVGSDDAKREENPFSRNRELSLKHAAMLDEQAAKNSSNPRYARKYFVFEVHDSVTRIN